MPIDLIRRGAIPGIRNHNQGNKEVISLPFQEVIQRLEANDVRCYPTMKNGDWNQIVAQDNPNIPESTWFLVNNGMVEVDDDFRELYPL